MDGSWGATKTTPLKVQTPPRKEGAGIQIYLFHDGLLPKFLPELESSWCFSTHLIGSFLQVGVKIKNVWNHQDCFFFVGPSFPGSPPFDELLELLEKKLKKVLEWGMTPK